MNDLISVIVPVYKVEKYLNKCVESIVNQTYKNLEIILVDDGSPDNCPQMCDEWAKKDSRIKVIHKQNGGLSDARNAGLDIAQGEYIAFIDSDDFIHSDFFSVTHKILVENNADIASLDLFHFFEGQDTDLVCDYAMKNLEVKIFEGTEILKEYFVPQNKQVIYHGLCMKLYRRKCFNGLKFAVGRLHEDLYITYKLLEKANKFVFLPLKFYFYNRGNLNSICTSYKYKNFLDEYEAVIEMMDYFAKDAEIIDYVRKFAIGHFCYLISRTGIVVPASDVGTYEQMRQQMLDFSKKNKIFVFNDKNKSLKSKLGFWLMLTNYDVYRVVKKVWNVVKGRKE